MGRHRSYVASGKVKGDFLVRFPGIPFAKQSLDAQKPQFRRGAGVNGLGEVSAGGIPVSQQELRAAEFLKGKWILGSELERLEEKPGRLLGFALPAFHHPQGIERLG